MSSPEEPLGSEGLPFDHRSGFVAVIGKPNVGKSTLINAYVGQKVAIVSEKPQTTRRRIRGILTRPDAQVIFVDTPGIHSPRHKLGEFMVETAVRSIPDADVVLFMVDVSELPTDEDRQIAQLIKERCRAPVILVLNKADLLPPQRAKQNAEAYFALGEGSTARLSSLKSDPSGDASGRELAEVFADWMMISATRGDNRDKLLEMIIARLPEGPQYYPPEQVTDQMERAIAAELVREQVLRFTHQEVPHAVAVLVDEFREKGPGLTYISATIYVEKESQKGIIIGEGGRTLKRIGQAARGEIEQLLGTKVYLDLWVKVLKKWRKDEAALKWFGYAPPKQGRK